MGGRSSAAGKTVTHGCTQFKHVTHHRSDATLIYLYNDITAWTTEAIRAERAERAKYASMGSCNFDYAMSMSIASMAAEDFTDAP